MAPLNTRGTTADMKNIRKLETPDSFDTFRTTIHIQELLVNTRYEITIGVNILPKVTNDTNKE